MAENTRMQTGGAAASQAGSPGGVKVKKEPDSRIVDQHNHKFYIQFKGSDDTKYEINCTKPQTVLEVIKSYEEYELMKMSDDKIVIQRGAGDNENIIATHFPCTCLKEKDALIVSKTLKSVEEGGENRRILQKDEYSVFYINKEGGKNTITKKLFKSNKVKEFNFLCVYGEKNFTVQEALKRDGRFAELIQFKLSDYNDPTIVIRCTDKINGINGRKFKIQLPREEGANMPRVSGASRTRQAGNAGAASAGQQQQMARDETPGPSGDASQIEDSKLEDLMERSGFSAEDVDLEDIRTKLNEQFPELEEQFGKIFPGGSFKRALKLKRKNFGKIQKDFSEVRTLRKLLERGKSVCQVVVEGVCRCKCTGFVLVDNFIMTNAHPFKKCTDGNKLKEGANVHVLFNFENPPSDICYKFKVEDSYIYDTRDYMLDYAILKVQPEGQIYCPTAPAEVPAEKPAEEPAEVPAEEPAEQVKIPPGLLEYFWEMPEDGGACIIGHPDGKLKQIDLTCVIEPEKREDAAVDRIHSLKSFPFILHVVKHIEKKGIERIMMGGDKVGNVMTYDTFMYHGASGSPVFDAEGRVCALHTAGFVYEFKNIPGCVIEFGQSLEIIMKHLVKTLTDPEFQGLLEKIGEVSEKNLFLKKVLESVEEE